MPNHRPGSLHQSNKSFKSKHASKGALRAKNNGKVSDRPGVKSKSTSKSQQQQQQHGKQDRRNSAKMLREKIRQERQREHRFFTGRQRAPKLIALVPLSSDIQPVDILDRWIASLAQEGIHCTSTPTPNVDVPQEQGRHRSIELDGQTFLFLELPRVSDQQIKQCDKMEVATTTTTTTTTPSKTYSQHFMDVLAACQVADYVVAMASAVQEVDPLGRALLEAIAEQGVASVLGTISVCQCGCVGV